VISAKQALTWLDGRNNSSFGNMSWSDNQLTFDITARSSANNIRAMLPVNSATGTLVSITRDGNPLTFTVQTIKGIQYAFFAPVTGTSTYVATYGSGLRVANPPVTDIVPAVTTATTELAKTASVPGPEITKPGRLIVNIQPNPSTNNFTITISSNDENPVRIKVTDMFGRVIETYNKVTSAGMLKLGQNWTSGVYFAEVVQGEQRKLIKMVKTN
ncbi:MAG TPA: T9SS type A sorting domain-containing protein, partial [Chitinophagaceae bacterium]|nr:T9SS type A sorting domain-containing protein [Chitinophagaceae bacterium]